MKSEETISLDSTFSDEELREAAARSSDPQGTPENPEVIPPGQDPPKDDQFQIGAEEMHAVMTLLVKSGVEWVSERKSWTVPSDPQWYEITTKSLEMCLEKYLGKFASGPEAALILSVGIGWILPNVMEARAKASEAKSSAAAGEPVG